MYVCMYVCMYECVYVCMYMYIKVDLQEVEWRGIDWIGLAQDRGWWWALVNAIMNFRVP